MRDFVVCPVTLQALGYCPVKKQYTAMLIYWCVLLLALLSTSPLCIAATKKDASDPKALIGQEIVGNDYPNGWRARGNPFFNKEHSLDGITISRNGTHVFVLRKIIGKLPDPPPRRAVIVDAVKLHANPSTLTNLFIGGCKHSGEQEKPYQVIYAEVTFKKCERYSSKVRAAWLVDSKTEKITPYSPTGMRCVDTFFNNGPDGPKCPPIAAEW